MRSIDFLNWCKANDIDTEWLGESASQPDETESNRPPAGNAATNRTAPTEHLATKEGLVEAFGCSKQMFENVHKVAWLKDACNEAPPLLFHRSAFRSGESVSPDGCLVGPYKSWSSTGRSVPVFATPASISAYPLTNSGRT